jgi:adenylosuccinate lyase
MIDFEFLQYLKTILQAKGMKGAVGTAASYTALLKNTKMKPDELEQIVMKKTGLSASLISTQVYTRKFDYLILTALNSIASSIGKFAGDLRILQSPMYGEWSEPFGKKQVGSSAMPFKKNPINSEKICSLARYILMLPNVALENATVSYLERTLDDSANKRLIIPEAFLALDEILKTVEKIIAALVVNEKRIAHNLAQYAPFAATETILMESVKKGADRQVMHETLREISMIAWAEIQEGKPNLMAELLSEDKIIKKYLTVKEITTMLNASDHIGTAPQRALTISKKIKKL